MQVNDSIAVIVGGGAFATAMGIVLSHQCHQVYLVLRSQRNCEDFKDGENKKYLPGIPLPSNLKWVVGFDEIIKNHKKIHFVGSAIPTAYISEYIKVHQKNIIKILAKGCPFVVLSKGISPDTFEMADELYLKHLGEFKDQLVYLSGPAFAREVALKQITAVTMASKNLDSLNTAHAYLDNDFFKTLLSFDVRGVLLGGALKNVLAIGAGIIEGLGYSYNTRAALITRGLAEMLRFGKSLGAQGETFYGLSGVGDLILTTTGDKSRNKQLGLEIAKGKKIADITQHLGGVAEGYYTTKAAYLLAKENNIRARVFEAIYQVLFEEKNAKEVIEELLRIPASFEVPITPSFV